jgi:hypothetical protein
MGIVRADDAVWYFISFWKSAELTEAKFCFWLCMGD